MLCGEHMHSTPQQEPSDQASMTMACGWCVSLSDVQQVLRVIRFGSKYTDLHECTHQLSLYIRSVLSLRVSSEPHVSFLLRTNTAQFDYCAPTRLHYSSLLTVQYTNL